MKRVRRIVRGLKWSIRLERLEDRLPLDGGLGAVVQEQLQSIYFDYAQIQTMSFSNSSSTEANSGLSGNFDLFFHAIGTPSAYKLSEGSSTAYNHYDGNRWVESRGITAADNLLIVEAASDRGHIPIPNPIMIPLPTPPELVAISQPIEGSHATPMREITTQLAERQDTKAQTSIERTIIGEHNQRTMDSPQSILENFAANAYVPDQTTRVRVPSSAESTIKAPVENVRGVSSEPIAQTTESRTNRISRDVYYERTAYERQELGWSTDELASATRQQVISESSTLLAIIASNASKSSMLNKQAGDNIDADQVEANVWIVSHAPHFEPRAEVLQANHSPVTDNSDSQSSDSVEIATNQSTRDRKGFLPSSWSTYVLALAGMTLSLAYTETREIPSEPELLTAKTNRLFPFGKGSV